LLAHYNETLHYKLTSLTRIARTLTLVTEIARTLTLPVH